MHTIKCDMCKKKSELLTAGAVFLVKSGKFSHANTSEDGGFCVDEQYDLCMTCSKKVRKLIRTKPKKRGPGFEEPR